MTETDNFRPSASLTRRLAAMVYDSFLILAITLAYAGAVLALRILMTDAEAAQIPYSGLPGTLFAAGIWFWPALFYSWCWQRGGQTLGMKTWRLRLEQADGTTPTWRQCWLRTLLAPISFILLGIGYWWCLVGEKQCLHDLWTATRVVVLPRPAR